MNVSVPTTKGAGKDTGGIGMSAGVSARRGTAMMEKSSTKILVSARGCAHMSTQDATDTTPLTTTPVGAGAAARVRTMRFLIQGTVCAKGRLPTHRQPGTPILQRPGTPLLQRPGTPILQPPLSLHRQLHAQPCAHD